MSDLSANELARRAGVTYRQLDYWCRIGLLPDTARGSGSARRFDASDFAVVCRLRALLDAGVSLQSARRVVSYLRDPEGCRYLYVDAVGGGRVQLRGARPRRRGIERRRGCRRPRAGGVR